MPFLNSTMLLPSERATDGKRPPNKMTAMMPNTIISDGTDSKHFNLLPLIDGRRLCDSTQSLAAIRSTIPTFHRRMISRVL